MIVDLIDKLIDRCIQLVKRREQDRRTLFEEFVEPAYGAFEAVHNDYLETFREYRRLLSESPVRMTASHPIFDRLRADSLFSQGKRAKLDVLQPLHTDPELGAFVAAISRYLTLSASKLNGLYGSVSPPVVDPEAGKLVNIIRARLQTDLLSQIARGNVSGARVPSVLFVQALDRVLELIQSHNAQVIGEYESLKKALLHPRKKRSAKAARG